jgi:1-acyl-sn-glycerol-3-phosphate acyltransferase
MSDLRSLLDLVARAATRPVDADRLDQIDPVLLGEAAPLVDAACRAWFDLEVRGTEHLPAGAALVVGNHTSGITFVEALGWGARLFVDGHMPAPWHGLAHDGIVDMPFVGPFLVRAGAVRATHANADAAFRADRKVVVFPGGNPEAFRPWRERAKIRLQGRTGFLRLALRHRVPIVPVVFHGGHDGFVVLAENRWLARATGARRLLRTDVWPLYAGLPWGLMLGPMFHLPLPVKVTTQILPPIPVDAFGPDAADDPAVLAALYDRVTATMQAGLDALVAENPRPLSGARRRLRRVAKALRAA